MRVAKILNHKKSPIFAEVVRTGSVAFDERPGWILLCMPIGARPRRQELFWIHPEETQIDWIRDFSFAE